MLSIATTRLALYFAAYALFVAPLQFHVDLFLNWRLGLADPVGRALAAGTLYFASAVLAGEAWIRCEQHPDLYKGNANYSVLKLMALAVMAITILCYVADTFRIIASGGTQSSYPSVAQSVLCGVSVLVSFFVFAVMLRNDLKRRERRRAREAATA